MPTMADVAETAKVSITTVSHVVNGTRIVGEATRRRVLEAIDKLGYAPNTLARSLVTARTQTLGLAISGISNYYFANMIAAIEGATSRNGYTLLLTETHDDVDQELQVVKTLQQRRVDGIFLATSVSGSRPSPALQYLLQLRVPTVLVDRLASDEFDRVGTENTEAVATLVSHVFDLGHTRIGMISGLKGLQTTEERLTGYVRGLRACGLHFDPELVRTGRSNADDAEQAVYRLLALRDRPTALVIANNHMAIGALKALRKRNLEIPRDIAFVSFDDFEWADFVRPRLTTMAQRINEVGEQAAKLMETRLANPTLRPREIRLPPVFMDRESCGCQRD